jgi:hypothetical protein
MSVEGSRVIFLPGGPWKVVSLPNPVTGALQNFVVCQDSLYELREVDGDNPYDKQNHLRPTTKKDNKTVRSLILEGDEKQGLIIEEGALLVSTKFNLSFILIAYFASQTNKNGSRFQSSEDLFDIMQENICGLKDIPESIIQNALATTCETVVEGDELFFKYSDKKTLQWLQARVTKLSQNFPTTILEALVKPLLYPVNLDEKIPDSITKSALEKFSIMMISSYLSKEWNSKLVNCYDFRELDVYIEDVQMQKAEKKAAQESLGDMNHLNAENKRNSDNRDNGPQKKKPAPAKKQIKVKVQKGALDLFFKKKA